MREGRTELRKATGFWMGLGVELLEMGEEALGGSWELIMLFRKEAAGRGEVRKGGLVGDLSTLTGKVPNGGGDMGRVGELAAEEFSSAASSCSRGTGDSFGEGDLTGEKV